MQYFYSSFIKVIGMIIIDNEVEKENYTRQLAKAIILSKILTHQISLTHFASVCPLMTL